MLLNCSYEKRHIQIWLFERIIYKWSNTIVEDTGLRNLIKWHFSLHNAECSLVEYFNTLFRQYLSGYYTQLKSCTHKRNSMINALPSFSS